MTNFEQPKSIGLLRSLLLLVLILFGFWVLNDQGLVAIVLEGDKSHISKAILSLWVIVSIYWIYISRNIYLEKSFLANSAKSKKILSINKYIRSLKQGEDKELLLRIFEAEYAKKLSYGWMAADISAMSSGMAVALYTTLTGLISSILIRLEFQIASANVATLINELSFYTEE